MKKRKAFFLPSFLPSSVKDGGRMDERKAGAKVDESAVSSRRLDF